MKLWAVYPWIPFCQGSLKHFTVPENLGQALLSQLIARAAFEQLSFP